MYYVYEFYFLRQLTQVFIQLQLALCNQTYIPITTRIIKEYSFIFRHRYLICDLPALICTRTNLRCFHSDHLSSALIHCSSSVFFTRQPTAVLEINYSSKLENLLFFYFIVSQLCINDYPVSCVLLFPQEYLTTCKMSFYKLSNYLHSSYTLTRPI